MSVIFLFVEPLVLPDKISLVNFSIFCLSKRSSLPISEFKLKSLNAVWRTDLFSVSLIFSPLKRDFIFFFNSQSSHNLSSSSKVSSLIMFFEKSKNMLSNSIEKFSILFFDESKRSIICIPAISSLFLINIFHASVFFGLILERLIYGIILFWLGPKLVDFILSNFSLIGFMYARYSSLSLLDIGLASGSFCFRGSTCLPFFQNL